MRAAAELLASLGIPPRVASASQQWLEQLIAEMAAGDAPPADAGE